ncbi:MAG: insulinase family protein [Syntrophobacterales bacterium]|nr:insulinase family protein [Syntrophobacterales bacterium]
MVEKTVLPNGIRIITEKIPFSHVVSVGFWINAGSRDEEKSRAGITHLLEHMLFKGTSRRSTKEIAKELDALGGYSNAFTTKENLCLYGKVLDKHLPKLIDIFMDILLESKFDHEELLKEQQVILQEISMVEDSPEEYIHTLFSEKFWSEHPLGHPICGYRSSVLSITREELLRFKDKVIHPKKLLITAAGNIEHKEFVALLESTLKTLPWNDQCWDQRVQPERNIFQQAIVKDLEQVHICIGTQGVSLRDPSRFFWHIFNMILGNSMSSRLFQEVREKRGLAYSIYSFLNSYEDTGLFGIYAAVDPSNTEELLRVVKGEIEKILDDGISESELLRAKDCLVGSLYLNMDGTEAYMNRLAKNEIIHGRDVSPEEVEAKILSISCEDMKGWLKSSPLLKDLSILFLGPLKDRNIDRLIGLII